LNKLFRDEAIEAMRDKLLGDVIAVRPAQFWIITTLAVFCTASLIAFAAWAEYARRERVEGFLELDEGVAKILAPDPGTVAELFIREGAEVQANEIVAKITIERSTESGTLTSVLIERQLNERKIAITREQEQVQLLGMQQTSQLKLRIADLQQKLMQTDREISIYSQRVDSTKELYERYRKLAAEGFMSEMGAAQKRDTFLEQQVGLEALRNQKFQTAADLRAAQADLPILDTRIRGQISQLQLQRDELDERLAQEQSKRESIIRAPVSGTITNIAVAKGDSLAVSAPIATVVPKGATLRAKLMVPSSAVGFIKTGNDVTLRYDAFPFQRFGQFHGTVQNVGRTTLPVGEYQVLVRLDQQALTFERNLIPLRPGMKLNADILLERRSILGWIFDPLIALKERIR
jgi:membrane fusion protein